MITQKTHVPFEDEIRPTCLKLPKHLIIMGYGNNFRASSN